MQYKASWIFKALGKMGNGFLKSRWGHEHFLKLTVDMSSACPLPDQLYLRFVILAAMVDYIVKGDVAIIEVNNPPVNALR